MNVLVMKTRKEMAERFGSLFMENAATEHSKSGSAVTASSHIDVPVGLGAFELYIDDERITKYHCSAGVTQAFEYSSAYDFSTQGADDLGGLVALTKRALGLQEVAYGRELKPVFYTVRGIKVPRRVSKNLTCTEEAHIYTILKNLSPKGYSGFVHRGLDDPELESFLELYRL